MTSCGKTLAQFGDTRELGIAIFGRGTAQLLVVHPQREAELFEQSTDGFAADVHTEAS